MNSWVNQTITYDPVQDFSTTPAVLKTVTIFLILVLISGSNLCIIAVVLLSKAYKCVQGILLGSLSFTDLLFGILIALPSWITSISKNSNWADAWCPVFAHSISILTVVSVLHISAINLDKFLKTAFPCKYQQYNDRSRTLAILTISIIWLSSCLSVVVPIALVGGSKCHFFPNVRLHLFHRLDILMTSALIIVLAVCMSVGLNCKLLSTARRYRKQKFVSGSGASSNPLKKRDVKAIWTILWINLSFIISYVPGVIMCVCRYVFRLPLNADLVFVMTWIMVSSNFWNIIVYFKTNANFRKHFKQACQSCPAYRRPNTTGDISMITVNATHGISNTVPNDQNIQEGPC